MEAIETEVDGDEGTLGTEEEEGRAGLVVLLLLLPAVEGPEVLVIKSARGPLGGAFPDMSLARFQPGFW